MINLDFNKKTLLEELKRQRGWLIDYLTIWTYEKKGFIKPSSYIANGKRKVPIYYRSDIPKIIDALELAEKVGKVRIKKIY
jgi:hypothetical protein